MFSLHSFIQSSYAYVLASFGSSLTLPLWTNKWARTIDHARDLTIKSKTNKRELSPTYLSTAKQQTKGRWWIYQRRKFEAQAMSHNVHVFMFGGRGAQHTVWQHHRTRYQQPITNNYATKYKQHYAVEWFDTAICGFFFLQISSDRSCNITLHPRITTGLRS